MAANTLSDNDVVITGIGMVTALGVGAQANWKMIASGAAPVFDSEKFAPYTVHPLPEIDWADQISKRDQRQMEPWQRVGTFAAGLALEDAGMKGVEPLTSTMDMIVAAGGGERDVDVDTMILSEARQEGVDTGVLVNEKLTTELRPTLFLAQLSNLLAGNISIVHKVTGSSRTFMGEDGAGISAVKTAAARIRSGQSTHALVGGSFNAEHPDMLLSYEMSHYLMRDGWAPVWHRDSVSGGGVNFGSGGIFLVLESRKHANDRDASIYASIGTVQADQGANSDEALASRLNRLNADTELAYADMIISTASGEKSRTATEKSFLTSTAKNVPVRGISSATGYLKEAQFPLGIAVAALSAFHGKIAGQIDSRFESSANVQPNTVGVLSVGCHSGEGVAIIRAEQAGTA